MNEGRDELVLVVLGDLPMAPCPQFVQQRGSRIVDSENGSGRGREWCLLRDKFDCSHDTEILHIDLECQLQVAGLAERLNGVEAMITVGLMGEQFDLVLVQHGVDDLDILRSWLNPQHLFDEEGGEKEPRKDLSVKESNACDPSGHLQPLEMVLVDVRSGIRPQCVATGTVGLEHTVATVCELGGRSTEPLAPHAISPRVLARQIHFDSVVSFVTEALYILAHALERTVSAGNEESRVGVFRHIETHHLLQPCLFCCGGDPGKSHDEGKVSVGGLEEIRKLANEAIEDRDVGCDGGTGGNVPGSRETCHGFGTVF
mmetsp:Transcript_8363/g.18247  ORF Transcript_8363/g.18247 Transcript_8363/m.18247 type:complete len:315 (+) Transcript_8363:965-1909(+)